MRRKQESKKARKQERSELSVSHILERGHRLLRDNRYTCTLPAGAVTQFFNKLLQEVRWAAPPLFNKIGGYITAFALTKRRTKQPLYKTHNIVESHTTRKSTGTEDSGLMLSKSRISLTRSLHHNPCSPISHNQPIYKRSET